MPGPLQADYMLLHPEYWDGHSVFDEPTGPAAEDESRSALGRAELHDAKAALCEGIEEVAAGNCGEIQFSEGVQFDPSIGSGSLVVLEGESVSQWDFDDPYRQLDSGLRGEPIITRPYTEHWLRSQREAAAIEDVGFQQVTFGESNTVFTRILHWGVMIEKQGTTVVQPFDFRHTRLGPDGQAQIYSGAQPLKAIPLPIRVGEVAVNRPLHINASTIRSMHRFRSIDVVYPLPRNQKVRERVRHPLARVALPKWVARTLPTY